MKSKELLEINISSADKYGIQEKDIELVEEKS